MRMIAASSTVLWFHIFLVSSLPTETKIKQEEIASLVDLKFVNLDRLKTITSTETGTIESNKCDCLVRYSSLSRVKRYVGGIPVYSRGLPVIVIQSQAYDEYLKNQKYPNTPPTSANVIELESENNDIVPFNPMDLGSENNDIVPFNPNKDKCDCSEDAETLRVNDVSNFMGPIAHE